MRIHIDLQSTKRSGLAAFLLGIFLTAGAVHAQEDTSLSPSLSDPLSDTLSGSSSVSGFNTEVVSGASSFSLTSRRNGISDPTGALLDNSPRTPNVSAGVNSDPGQQFAPSVEVDSTRASLASGYTGSRAAFQPAFSGAQMRSFRSPLRLGQQVAAGSVTSIGLEASGATAFGRSSAIEAFGTTGSAVAADASNGLPVIYIDQSGAAGMGGGPPNGSAPAFNPNSVYAPTLVTTVGNVPGQYSSPMPGMPMSIVSSNGYAGPGNFPDSTRGTAGSPPEGTETRPSLLSSVGTSDSPFRSLSQPGTSFLRPSLNVSTRSRLLTLSPETLATSPAERRARIQAILSGHPQSSVPTFEQKRVDRLRNARPRPGERLSHVVLSPSTQQVP